MLENIKGTTLATGYRGKYILSEGTVYNIVTKDSGYKNCVMGDIQYFINLTLKYPNEYTFTKEGENILNTYNNCNYCVKCSRCKKECSLLN